MNQTTHNSLLFIWTNCKEKKKIQTFPQLLSYFPVESEENVLIHPLKLFSGGVQIKLTKDDFYSCE